MYYIMHSLCLVVLSVFPYFEAEAYVECATKATTNKTEPTRKRKTFQSSSLCELGVKQFSFVCYRIVLYVYVCRRPKHILPYKHGKCGLLQPYIQMHAR